MFSRNWSHFHNDHAPTASVPSSWGYNNIDEDDKNRKDDIAQCWFRAEDETDSEQEMTWKMQQSKIVQETDCHSDDDEDSDIKII